MNNIKILGASGSKTETLGTTSFQVSKDIIIDAGNILNTLGKKSSLINHIFLTHAHCDHIIDLPFIIESYYESRSHPLVIYASKETIKSIQNYIFNGDIWPDFSKINLFNGIEKSIIYKIIEENDIINIGKYEIKAIHANHDKGSFAYSIISNNLGCLISGDTYINDKLWNELNHDIRLKSLFIECSFSSNMDKLALQSKHLTPKLLNEEIKKLKRKDLNIFIYHMKPLYVNKIKQEIIKFKIISSTDNFLQDKDLIHIKSGRVERTLITEDMFEDIMDINFALSSQTNKDKLYEMILSLTRKVTQCEAGSLYIKSKNNKYLEFTVVQNDPLKIFMGGTKNALTWEPLPFNLANGKSNDEMVAIVCAKEKRIINILDVYDTKEYTFDGTIAFDKKTGFRSQSMLVIPLINHENEVIGVLQLINKINNNKRVSFNKFDEKIVKALSSQAAMALTNTQLILSLENFLNDFIKTIAKAIDAKSPYTMNHIEKVSTLSNLIAQSINNNNNIYEDINFTENDYKQIELAAWVHDIGKISIPEYVMDKATKLQGINDKITLIEEKFENLKKDYEILCLKNKISKEDYINKINEINDDMIFLRKTNIGTEFMNDEDISRIEKISKYSYIKNSKKESLLIKEDIYNLSVRKGTLTSEEKHIMNHHATLSFEMLSTLSFPKKYSDVLNIASNHHEKLDGTGYPRGLSDKDLTLKDKIMILSDIFEALTSSDRPYKKAKKLSEVFAILFKMANNNEIDKELLLFFYNSDALKQYSKDELNKEQCDKVEVNF